MSAQDVDPRQAQAAAPGAPTLSTSIASAIDAAFDEVGLIGNGLRQSLRTDIASKILVRKGRDVVLLTGVTGAGKEKVAATMHAAARRHLDRRGKLIEVSCANLGGGLFESELFGARRGAFTSAERDREGLVDEADDGTLVLDEVQSLSAADQARLLRFLGEREYRPVGDREVKRSNALIVLASNEDLSTLVQKGAFRRDLLDRTTAKIRLPALFERRADIGELAQSFALEAAADLGRGAEDFVGLTRRARADIETAVISAQEVSVRRLREIIRDVVFLAATDALPEALESEMVLPVLSRELSFKLEMRDAVDHAEIENDLPLAIAKAELRDLSRRHHLSDRALERLVRSVQAIIDEMDDQPRTYRNVVERMGRLSKVALWLTSGAKSQADFRKYFGKLEHEMPTKSVAHQIYYDVFPRDEVHATVNHVGARPSDGDGDGADADADADDDGSHRGGGRGGAP